jgi:diphthine synthase
MLFIIGLGLNSRGISKEGLLALEKCKRVYLESYTVDFPYPLDELRLGKDIEKLNRAEVESDKLIREAKGRAIALLVYGCPLFATTHMSLILDAEKAKVKTKIIYSASVFDAVAETGLQLYKFGKIASMPSWNNSKNYTPDFLKYVKENLSINAHSLILVDIGLGFQKALFQLEENAKRENINLDKIVVCSNMGAENEIILYGDIKDIREEDKELKITPPFCIIIPSEMHFLEKTAIERFSI